MEETQTWTGLVKTDDDDTVHRVCKVRLKAEAPAHEGCQVRIVSQAVRRHHLVLQISDILRCKQKTDDFDKT